MSAPNKRSAMMTLYVKTNDPFSNIIRMILAEKDVVADIIDVNQEEKIEELNELNPYGLVPTLLSKDLILYESNIIFEYIEDRFPYPPLLSVFPIERAQARMLLIKINNQLMPVLVKLLHSNDTKIINIKKINLLKILLSFVSTLNKQNYLLGDDFSIIDCAMSIIIYHLYNANLRFPKEAISLIEYSERLFKRESFKKTFLLP